MIVLKTGEFYVGRKGSKGSKKVAVVIGNSTGRNDIGSGQLVKIGKSAKPICNVLGSMSKGEARKLRKALRANGFENLAAAKRAA